MKRTEKLFKSFIIVIYLPSEIVIPSSINYHTINYIGISLVSNLLGITFPLSTQNLVDSLNSKLTQFHLLFLSKYSALYIDWLLNNITILYVVNSWIPIHKWIQTAIYKHRMDNILFLWLYCYNNILNYL